MGIYVSKAHRNEQQAVLHQPGDRSIHIHPWSAGPGIDGRNDSAVYVAVGRLKKSGAEKYDEDDDRYDYINAIFDRDDFVESILAVFPELKRVED